MSFPTIPQIAPTINIDRTQVVNLLLASIALEELSLAHIINAEGEKLQAVLGTLPGLSITATSISGLLSVNREVRRTLQTVLKKQMLLEFKLEDILDIPPAPPPSPPTPPVFVEAGSAWAVGTEYGEGNAQYTTLENTETEKTVVLGLGNNNIPIGTVHLLRQNSDLLVTISTVFPYVMDEVQLFVGDTIPPTSAPGLFPYKYTVTDPSDFFTTYTFTVDVSGIPGTIYVAAHAHILQQV